RARQHAAVAVDDGDLRAGDLPFAAFAAQLPRGVDDEEDAVHARMHAGQAAAVGVDRQLPARRDRAVGNEAAAFAFRAEAEVFEEQDRVDRERVVQLDDVGILRGYPGHLERARA